MPLRAGIAGRGFFFAMTNAKRRIGNAAIATALWNAFVRNVYD